MPCVSWWKFPGGGMLFICVASLAFLWLAAGTVNAQYNFTTIVVTGQLLPGGEPYPGTLVTTGSGVSVSGSTVAFTANGSAIYTGSGGQLTHIVSSGVSVPAGTIRTVSAPAQSGVSTAFVAFDLFSTPLGVYTGAGDGLTRVADTSSVIPGSAGVTFTRFTSVSASGNAVAFTANNATWLAPTHWGVYVSPGSGSALTVIADRSTTIPNSSGTFTSFSDVQIHGSSVSFLGAKETVPSTLGVYLASSGTINRIADTSTAIPNGTGEFVAFRDQSLSEGRVAFISAGVGGDGLGVYTGTSGTPVLIADKSTNRPTGGVFSFFNKVEISGQWVAFMEGQNFANGTGLYLRRADGTGDISKIIAAGDTLDGKVISSFRDFSFDPGGPGLAFTVQFSDATAGVYFTPVPEPTTALAAAAVGLGVIALRARARRTAEIGESEGAPGQSQVGALISNPVVSSWR